MLPIIRLNEANCKDCYKCIRNCLLKAIRYSNGHAEIIQDECIGCGECVVTCPRRDHYVMSDLDEVKRAIRTGRQVVASVDPAFISDFDVSCIEDMRDALQQLGFSDCQEMAIGAELVSREYERIMRKNEVEVLISSACPSINLLIRKFYPDMLKYLAPVESPMVVHCKRLRREYPDACVVCVAPCYVRKDEAMETGSADAVIMFSDLKQWMYEKGVVCHNSHTQTEHGIRARRYPRSDGIVKSMSKIPGWSRVSIDGVGDCISALEEMRMGNVTHAFLEMTACEGSCINGPAIRSNRYENRIRGSIAVNSYAGDFIFGVTEENSIRATYSAQPVAKFEPDEALVEQILEKLGKNTAETALNCGCCGYPTCREMAFALCQGKAEMDMCLPYLHEQTEHHSQEVVSSTLEAADRVIDKQMRVVQDIASILGETTAETKIMLEKLKEAIQA
ncbi:MAG: 4Fe-4S binding protein [Clostridia bacterium]|nr:4Fe-4S binding protein [Clostridia bacterium]